LGREKEGKEVYFQRRISSKREGRGGSGTEMITKKKGKGGAADGHELFLSGKQLIGRGGKKKKRGREEGETNGYNSPASSISKREKKKANPVTGEKRGRNAQSLNPTSQPPAVRSERRERGERKKVKGEKKKICGGYHLRHPRNKEGKERARLGCQYYALE